MDKLHRAKEIAMGLIMIFLASVMIKAPQDGYVIIICIFAAYFTLKAVSTLFYYATMTRYMVGGRTSLYTGIIMLDLGILTFSLTEVPHYYVLIYLVVLHAFSGVVEILRSLESRRYAGSWRLKMSHGIVDIIIATVCIIFIRQLNEAVVIYSIGLVYSSVIRIISACRRTRLIYIQ